MTRETPATLAALFDELAEIDGQLVALNRELQLAKAKFSVASTKFVAIRDAITARMGGRSPYGGKGSRWQIIQDDQERFVTLPSGGRFRFMGMQVGDAVEQVLSEAKEPMTLDEIVEVIKTGTPESSWLGARSVNAALTNKVDKTIQKTDDGKYSKHATPSVDEFLKSMSMAPGNVWRPPAGARTNKEGDDLDDLPF